MVRRGRVADGACARVQGRIFPACKHGLVDFAAVAKPHLDLGGCTFTSTRRVHGQIQRVDRLVWPCSTSSKAERRRGEHLRARSGR